LLLAFAAAGLPARAFAQPAAAPKQQADQLFKDGREYVKVGRYAEACPMFKESQRLDPSLAARCNIAVVCHQMTGQTGTAWTILEEVAREARADAGKTQSLKCATDAMEALKPDLALVSLDTRAVEATPGLALTRDGAPVPSSQWGKPVAVDPGDHAVEASAPGYKPWRGTATATARSTYALAIPALEPLPRGAEQPSPEPSRPPVPGAPPEPPRWTVLHTSAVTATAVGGVGILVGAVAGLIALVDGKTAGCSGGFCPTPAALDSSHAAYQAGTASTVGFVIGGVALAGGATLWILAPSRTPQRTAALRYGIDLRPSGLSLRGAF
jgi:serine/threonine-protein kinase